MLKILDLWLTVKFLCVTIWHFAMDLHRGGDRTPGGILSLLMEKMLPSDDFNMTMKGGMKNLGQESSEILVL